MTPYKIYIVQYAKRMATSSEILLGDLHADPMPMAYYVWAVTNGEHTIVVDMGFTAEMAAKRGREILFSPAEGLDKIGIDASTVQQVVVTHLHWDHVGTYADFPQATFYLQDEEMAFCTGRHASAQTFLQALEPEDIAAMVRLNFDGRLHFVDGSMELFPGFTLHKVGGHTAGMMIVEVETARGTAVIASDASHFYRNLREAKPFPILHDVTRMLDAFSRMKRMAARESFILPGHDPEVLRLHPNVTDNVALLE